MLKHWQQPVPCAGTWISGACMRYHALQVQEVYQQALTLHIVALAICFCMGAAFIFVILLPTIRRIANERRRVAELLSHVSTHTKPRQPISSP